MWTREPTKAIYERFEANPSEEFDFFLALKLGWRSVAELRRGMSMQEWQHWSIYFQRRQQERELALAQAGG